MNKKVIFSIATVSLGVLGILTIVTSNVQFFALVVLVFLFLIAMFVGYSIHQVNENHRRSRKQIQAAQQEMVQKNQKIQKQVDVIMVGLRKVNVTLARHDKTVSDLGDGSDNAFKRVRNDIKSAKNGAIQTNHELQKQVDAIVTGLRKANEVLSRHEKLLGELGDGNAVSFKRVRNDIKATRGLVSEQGDCLREAQRALSTRFTLYYDSLRNVLEDFETYGIDHGSLQALNQDVISTVRELDAKVVTAIKENAEFLQSQSQDSASIKSVADDLFAIHISGQHELEQKFESQLKLVLERIDTQIIQALDRFQSIEDELLLMTSQSGEKSLDRLSEKLVELGVRIDAHNSWQMSNQSIQIESLRAALVRSIEETKSIVDPADILDPIEKSLETLEKDLRSSFFKGNQSLFNKLQIAMYDETQETEALLHLQSRIEPRAVLPSLGRWAMDAKSMLQLVDLFDEVKPKLVVEIGSGTSSVWLGYLAEEGHAQVVSIENDEGFAERTRAIITDHELEETVNVIYAPLTDLEVRGEEFIWYRTDFIEDLSNIDLLIVDGPPGSTGKHARYPALPVLADKLAPGAVVVLDDTHRKDETQIAEQWSAEYSLKRIDRAMSRLAIFRKTGSEW